MADDCRKKTAVAESGRNPVSKHQPIRLSLSVENKRADAGRDGRTRLARPISQAPTRAGKKTFPCPAAHKQEWQPYPADPSSDISD